MRFPEQYLQVLFSSFVPEIPYLARSRYTIEGDKQADKVHREAQSSPYCIHIPLFVAEAEQRVRVNNIVLAARLAARHILTALIIVTYRIACKISPPTKTDARCHSWWPLLPRT